MKIIFYLFAIICFVIAGCDSHDDEESNSTLGKWPSDYPVGGDSVAIISVSIGCQPSRSIGEMVVELYPDSAPNHVRNFKWLANCGFYSGLKFHRVIPGFVIQGGDPVGDGTGGPPWTIDAEFNGIPHQPGTVSMARAANPNSAGSQFFICLDTLESLDNQYSVFGKVIHGFDVADTICSVPLGRSPGGEVSVPLKSVIMTSVRIVARTVSVE